MTIFPSTIGTAHQSVSQSVSQSFSEDLVVAELTAEHGNTITTGGEHYASPFHEEWRLLFSSCLRP